MLRVKLRWTGLPGGLGYSVFHFRDFTGGTPTPADGDSAKARVNDYAFTIKGLIPPSVTLQVDSEAELIEDTNGKLVDVYGGSAPPTNGGSGSGTQGYSAPAGAVISWSTAGIRNGRRIRGRTFVVPLAGDAYENNGTLAPSALMVLGLAADTLRNPSGTPDLGVYARPTAPGANDGEWSVVTGHRIPDMAAVLRSRRA